VSANPVHDEVYSIQHYVITPVVILLNWMVLFIVVSDDLPYIQVFDHLLFRTTRWNETKFENQKVLRWSTSKNVLIDPVHWHIRIIYMSWLTILPNMNKFRHTISEKLRSQSITDGCRPLLFPSHVHVLKGVNNNFAKFRYASKCKKNQFFRL
jgi:hypothetical protein